MASQCSQSPRKEPTLQSFVSQLTVLDLHLSFSIDVSGSFSFKASWIKVSL